MPEKEMLPYRIDEVISEIAEILARGFKLYKAIYHPTISASLGIDENHQGFCGDYGEKS